MGLSNISLTLYTFSSYLLTCLIIYKTLWFSKVNKHHEIYVMVIIDEYDRNLNGAFKNGLYDKSSTFSEIFTYLLWKVIQACLIGIVEERGILPGLNKFQVHSVVDKEFPLMFAFLNRFFSWQTSMKTRLYLKMVIRLALTNLVIRDHQFTGEKTRICIVLCT